MPRCIKLEFLSPPALSPCAIGEPANISDLQFAAVYDDGSRELVNVTPKIFNESNLQSTGSQRTGVIAYKSQKLLVPIPLLPYVLEGIEVNCQTPLPCEEGQPVDKSLLRVMAVFSDGSRKEIQNYKIYPYDALTMADKELSIRYGRCRATLALCVQPCASQSLLTDAGQLAVESLPVVEQTEKSSQKMSFKSTPDFYPSTFGFRFKTDFDVLN